MYTNQFTYTTCLNRGLGKFISSPILLVYKTCINILFAGTQTRLPKAYYGFNSFDLNHPHEAEMELWKVAALVKEPKNPKIIWDGPGRREANSPMMERQTKTIPSSSRIGASQRYMFLSRSPTNKTTHPIYSTRRMKSNSVSFRLLMLSLRYAIPAKTGTTTPRKNLPISCSLMFSNIGCASSRRWNFVEGNELLLRLYSDSIELLGPRSLVQYHSRYRLLFQPYKGRHGVFLKSVFLIIFVPRGIFISKNQVKFIPKCVQRFITIT